MAYILSNANRFYCAIENSYGEVPVITNQNRFAGVKFSARQQKEASPRKDKTGSRTYPGSSSGGRRKTDFELKTYLSVWNSGISIPGYGPLFQAGMGAAPLLFAGGVVASSTSNSQITFSSPHGLSTNQAVGYLGELRFVTSLLDNSTILLNAPFSTLPPVGVQFGPTVTYLPASELPSISIFDYWSPQESVQRILTGAAVDTISINIDGDFHEFSFKGQSQDIVDSASFTAGLGKLASFPSEPTLDLFNQTAIPANLGQIWLGISPQRYQTITRASISIDNDLDMRSREFGNMLPTGVAPGMRMVTMDFSLFEETNDSCVELYQAARQQSPISVMLQLGQSDGELCGIYLPSIVPEVPEFDDSERRLQWRFQKSRAQGTSNDELVVAFG
jgi:hypothetical protein